MGSHSLDTEDSTQLDTSVLRAVDRAGRAVGSVVGRAVGRRWERTDLETSVEELKGTPKNLSQTVQSNRVKAADGRRCEDVQ